MIINYDYTALQLSLDVGVNMSFKGLMTCFNVCLDTVGAAAV